MQDHPSAKLTAARRLRLFQTASGEFAANGFNQASLNRIISAVGMSKSSFYHYFTDKTDLFEQVLKGLIAPLLGGVAAIDIDTLTEKNFWQTILYLTQGMAGEANNNPDLKMAGRMFYRSYDNPEERALVAPEMAVLSGWILQLIRRGQQLGLIRDDLPADFLLDMVLALGLATDRWMLGQWDDLQAEDRMAMNKKIMELFLGMLAPPGAEWYDGEKGDQGAPNG